MLETDTSALDSVATLVTLNTCGSLLTVKWVFKKPFGIKRMGEVRAVQHLGRLANGIAGPSHLSLQLVTTQYPARHSWCL